MSGIDQVLEERGTRYGEFTDHAGITQGIKDAMKGGRNWNDLDDDMKEALEMVAHKAGRILNGDPNYVDSWTDIIGYTRLVEKRLVDEQAPAVGSASSEAAGSETCDCLGCQLRRELEKAFKPAEPENIGTEKIEAALKVLLDAGVIKQVDGDS